MPQDRQFVVRLTRPDHPEAEPDFVLLQVSPKGPRPLDIDLIGTEGETVFSVSLKHNQTSSLKAKSSKIGQEEWERILSTIFLPTKAEDHAPATEGVEAVARVEEGSSLITIIIQKRIEGITQKLGTISLPSTDEEISIYEWCGLAVESRDTVKHEMETLKASLKAKDDRIKKFEESFADLIKQKNQSEDQLLEKFSLLLNEKKLKIRDQQRLLASSSVDPVKLETVEGSRTAFQERSAGPSRKGKRKVGENTQPPSDDESDGGFEKMEVDEAPDSEQDDARTADEETEDETASEDERDTLPIPPPKRNTVNDPHTETAAKHAVSTAGPDDDELPPPRSLPFARKPSVAPPRPEPVEGSETESDDDEL